MLLALLLTIGAGLATVMGALLALHHKMVRRSSMAIALAFAAGAMLFISFVEIIPKSIEALEPLYADNATGLAYLAFFAGIAVMIVMDKLLPDRINPSEREGMEEFKNDGLSKGDLAKLRRSGLMIALAIGLHNFPEGLVTFMSALQSPELGVSLAIAIAIHNVPEGIAIAAPIYAATKSRKKAFWYATLAGLAEPVGALTGFWLLGAILPGDAFGIIFAAVAGIMVFICLDELLPAARRYATRDHQPIYGAIGGMAVMAVSLMLF